MLLVPFSVSDGDGVDKTLVSTSEGDGDGDVLPLDNVTRIVLGGAVTVTVRNGLGET